MSWEDTLKEQIDDAFGLHGPDRRIYDSLGKALSEIDNTLNEIEKTLQYEFDKRRKTRLIYDEGQIESIKKILERIRKNIVKPSYESAIEDQKRIAAA